MPDTVSSTQAALCVVQPDVHPPLTDPDTISLPGSHYRQYFKTMKPRAGNIKTLSWRKLSVADHEKWLIDDEIAADQLQLADPDGHLTYMIYQYHNGSSECQSFIIINDLQVYHRFQKVDHDCNSQCWDERIYGELCEKCVRRQWVNHCLSTVYTVYIYSL